MSNMLNGNLSPYSCSLVHRSKEAKKKVEQILEIVFFDLYKSTEFKPFSPKDPAGAKDQEKGGEKKLIPVCQNWSSFYDLALVLQFSLLSSESLIL